MNIRIFVSGDCELNGLPRLKDNLLLELGCDQYNNIFISKGGSGKQQMKNKIGLLVSNAFASRSLDFVFSLDDIDNQSIPDYQKSYYSGVKTEYQDKYEPKYANVEIETWMIADYETLNDYGVLVEPFTPHNERIINENGKPKEILSKLFINNGMRYKATIDGVNLLTMLNIKRVYNRSDSFKHFVDNIIEKLNVDNPYIE